MQDFAREQIANLPSQAPFNHYQLGFITYFVSYLKTHHTDFIALQSEHENLLAALALAAKIQPTLFVTAVKTIHDYLLITGLFTIGQSLLEQALAAVSDTGDQIDLVIRLTQLNREQLGFSAARQQLKNLQPLSPSDSYRQAAILTELGICTALEGDQREAIAYFEQGLQLAQTWNHTKLLPALFLEMGIVICRLEQWDKALDCYQQGITIAQAQNNTVVLVMLYKSLGALHLLQNDYSQGVAYLQQGLEIARDTLNFPGVVLAANNLAVAHLDLLETDLAAALLQEAMLLGQRFGNVKWLCLVEYNLSLVARQQGDQTKAKVHLEQALLMAQKLNITAVMKHIKIISQTPDFEIKAHTLVFL